MKPYIKNLGKISITVDKDYYDPTKEYDRLVIVEKENDRTYISRQPVPANTSITNREYWIPLVTINGSFDYMIETTTEELRNLKADGNLIPGMNYMITDYNPETKGTIAIAGQNFEISNQVQYNNVKTGTYNIVLKATAKSDISEQGLAVSKRYKTPDAIRKYARYWNNAKFGAWTINVILDINDDRRPSWCKGEGAPVWINYMKDEWGNEAPFDFKVYGFALPEGTSLNQTENVKELDDGDTWFVGNVWYPFTIYEDSVGINGSISGKIKNTKVTDWNIVIGEVIDFVIEGGRNVIVNSNAGEDEPIEKVIIKGYDNRMFCDGADYDYNVIQGINNIIVNSSVTFVKLNYNCIIKDCEDVYLGEYNNTIVIRNCTYINIGNYNSDWDITYAEHVYIGNNNIKVDNDINPNYIHPGTSDGEIDKVGEIKIGNYNKNIRLYAPTRFNIGDYNRSITVKCTEEGFQAYDCTIGNNNNISIIYTDIHDVKIGDVNNIKIYADNTTSVYTIQVMIIGHNNRFNIIGNESEIHSILINNYNFTNNPLGLTSASNNKRFYVEEGVWESKSIND